MRFVDLGLSDSDTLVMNEIFDKEIEKYEKHKPKEKERSYKEKTWLEERNLPSSGSNTMDAFIGAMILGLW